MIVCALKGILRLRRSAHCTFLKFCKTVISFLIETCSDKFKAERLRYIYRYLIMALDHTKTRGKYISYIVNIQYNLKQVDVLFAV